MSTNAQAVPHNAGEWKLMKGLAVSSVAFAALQCSSSWIKPGTNLPARYYMACVFIVASFALAFMGTYASQNEVGALDHVSAICGATSIFMLFSILLPSNLAIQVCYWMLYGGMITMVMAFVWRRRTNNSSQTLAIPAAAEENL